MIETLLLRTITFTIDFHNLTIRGKADPIGSQCEDGFPQFFFITLHEEDIGILSRVEGGWKMVNTVDQEIVKLIGQRVEQFYRVTYPKFNSLPWGKAEHN